MGLGMNQKGTDAENPPQSGEDSDADVSTRLKPSEGEELEMTKIPIKTTDAGYPIVLGGSSKPCISTTMLTSMLIGFNTILCILGLIILIIAVWVKVDPVFFKYEATLRMEDFYTVCNILITVGVVLLVVGVLGCCGATQQSQWMLITYSVIFALMLLMELAAIVLIFYAPYSKTLSGSLENTMQAQINSRDSDPGARFFTDYIQQNLKCCGIQKPKNGYYGNVPKSCHNPNTGEVYERGCASEILKYLRAKAGIIGGISLPIILFHILSLLASSCLLHRIRKESSYPM